MRTAQKMVIMMLVSLIILVSYSFSGTAAVTKGSLTPPVVEEPTPDVKEPQDPDEPENPADPGDTPSLNPEPPYYVLTIIIDGNGSVQKNPDQPSYPAGTAIELTAMADAGWRFDHWSGDPKAIDNPDTIIMDSDKTVTIHFVEVNNSPYTSSTPNPPDAPSGGLSEQKTVTETEILTKLFSLDSWYTENPVTLVSIEIIGTTTINEFLAVQVVTILGEPVPNVNVESQGKTYTTDLEGRAVLNCFEKSGSYRINTVPTDPLTTPSAYVDVELLKDQAKNIGDLPPKPDNNGGGPGAGGNNGDNAGFGS